MTKLKVAIIGCGSIAQHRHIPEYLANENVEIVALCDSNKERVLAVAEKYNVKAYTDYTELLQNDSIDLVSVCTPNYLHAPISIAALQAKKHVLCEKPMATTEEEGKAMIAAAKENGKNLMIAHNQRFVPSHQKAKALIASGEIGKIYSFRTTFGHGGPEGWSVEGKDGWFFQKEKAIVGAMGDLGVHKTDLLRYILGEEIVEVASFVETNAKDFADVDDNAVCILKTESGIIGTLAASWAYVSQEDNSTIIYGEKAIIRLEDNPTYSVIVQFKNGETVRYELGKIQSNENGGQSNTQVINKFVQSILDNQEPEVTGEEGLQSLKVILAALESSEKKQMISVTKK